MTSDQEWRLNWVQVGKEHVLARRPATQEEQDRYRIGRRVLDNPSMILVCGFGFTGHGTKWTLDHGLYTGAPGYDENHPPQRNCPWHKP